MYVVYNAMDKDSNIRTFDIDVQMQQYTFSHLAGLLFATQFVQIALVVTEKAAFEDMHVKGFMQNDCAFASYYLVNTPPSLP